jgi:IMP dehydrogenase
VLERIVSTARKRRPDHQSIYGEPIKEDLIHQRISEIKKGGGRPSSPRSTARRAVRYQIARKPERTSSWSSRRSPPPATSRPVHAGRSSQTQEAARHPLVIGNVVTYEACLELMDVGADALLIGVGPGAACTSREVLGLGVPQVTARPTQPPRATFTGSGAAATCRSSPTAA